MILLNKNRLCLLPIKKQIRLCKDLSALLSAGVPMAKALEIAKFPPSVYEAVLKGTSLSDSFACFSKRIVNMLKVGEKIGELDRMLLLSADLLEKEENIKEKIFKKLLYPMVVILMSIVSVMFFFIIILPQLMTIFDDFAMPIPMQIKALIGLSSYAMPLAALFAAIFLALCLIFKKALFLPQREYIKYYFPVIGVILRKLHTAGITRSLALYLKAGYGLSLALYETSKTSSSVIFGAACLRIHSRVIDGWKLSDAVRFEKIFDPFFMQMLCIAEESGQMENILEETFNMLEEEAERKIKTITILIEPLSTILAGCAAAYVIFIMFSPMLKIFEFLE